MEKILNIRDLAVSNMVAFVRSRFADINRRNNYLGPTLLPAKTQSGLNWKYVKGAASTPIMASITAMGAESPIASRRKTLTYIEGEIPDIKRKIAIDGSVLYDLKTRTLKDAELQRAIDSVYDDTETMLAGVAARIEWLRWKALSVGTFDYTEDDVKISVDFQIPDSNFIDVSMAGEGYGGHYWTDTANSNFLLDLMTLCDYIEDQKGVRPARAVVPRAVLSSMLMNTKLGTDEVFGSTFPSKLMIRADFNKLMARYDLPNFTTYDVKVNEEDPDTKQLTESRLLPSDTCILLPPANVSMGNTLFAPTLSAIMGDKKITKKEAPGVYAKVWIEGEDTPVLWTKAEACAFPTLPSAELLGIMKVTA
jgi:hypothetical protein